MSEENKTRQLAFELDPTEPYGASYFVSHSGVADALSVLEKRLAHVLANPTEFALVYVYGAVGSGKTHLLSAFVGTAREQGLPSDKVHLLNLRDARQQDEVLVGRIVAKYDQLKASGGLFLVEALTLPEESLVNPHLRSRLLAGDVCEISYPSEEELKPLLRSLLERRNLKLSETSLEYLIKRIPRDLLSFDEIFARVNALSLEDIKPAGLGVVRRVVEEKRGGE